MKYKELKEKVEAWGEKYNYETEVEIETFNVYVRVKVISQFILVATISNTYMFTLETNWNYFTKIVTHARGELFDILIEFAKTPPADREDEKRFIIPLLGLVTTDGKQQYLTKNVTFFASRRDKGLRQIWEEKDLIDVPEVYRQFAVEFDEDREY